MDSTNTAVYWNTRWGQHMTLANKQNDKKKNKKKKIKCPEIKYDDPEREGYFRL